MIRVVGPNPAIDRIQVVPAFHRGAVHRAIEVISRAGGKSTIVARGLAHLGAPVTMYGFLGGATGQIIRDACVDLGISDRHLSIRGETRTTTIIVDQTSGQSTVINEPGPWVDEDDGRRLLDELAADCQPGDYVITNGSLPPGLRDSFHGAVIDVAQRNGALAVLDSSEASLEAGIERGPWLAKPNLDEFSGLVGRPLSAIDREAVSREMLAIVRTGRLQHLVVTMGESGSIYTDGHALVHLEPPTVRALNPTGSGDLMLAGIVFGLAQGQPMIESLALGTAAAAAGATHVEPDVTGAAEVAALRRLVTITRLALPGERGAQPVRPANSANSAPLAGTGR